MRYFRPQQADETRLRTTSEACVSTQLLSQIPGQVNTAETKIQVVLRSDALRDLPVAGRNFLSLVAVAPGVTGTGVAGFGASGGSQSDNFTNEASPSISANGRNQTGNSFTVDG